MDTNVVVRWLSEPKKLSREQTRVIEVAERRSEPLALSAISLIEIATIRKDGRHYSMDNLDEILRKVESDPLFFVLPITAEIAMDVARLGALGDLGDRTIAATARVHGLRLLTSDRRMIESNLVSVIE